MNISGEIRQAKVQLENILLKRSLKSFLGEDEIILEGSRREPIMLLYHFNFGYPFLNKDCELIIPTKTILGLDKFSELNKSVYNEVYEPKRLCNVD